MENMRKKYFSGEKPIAEILCFNRSENGMIAMVNLCAENNLFINIAGEDRHLVPPLKFVTDEGYFSDWQSFKEAVNDSEILKVDDTWRISIKPDRNGK